jgi:hypothetical protein
MSDEYLQEMDRLSKFKQIVGPVLGSVDSHTWCLRNGVEIVPEQEDLKPTEVFCMGFRVWERMYGGASTRKGIVRVLEAGLMEANMSMMWNQLLMSDIDEGERFVDFLVRLAGRVPVNEEDSDWLFLFPRDLYEKILVLGFAPP